jgi:hypothetical protein
VWLIGRYYATTAPVANQNMVLNGGQIFIKLTS